MYAEDFVYDGVALSDFNFIIASFDQAGRETRDVGTDITLNLTSSNYGKHHNIAGSSYDACITCTFSICKNPDIYSADEMAVTSDEYRDIARWLNRREFCQMQFISCCSDDDQKETPYYNATFNLKQILIDDVVYGIQLIMQTDSPFGYFGATEKKFTIDNGTMTYGSNSARYAVKFLDASGSEVDTTHESDLKLRASNADVKIEPSYGEDGNALNYTGDVHNLTFVPKYDASSSEVGYKVSDVDFSTVIDAEETNLLATDVTSASNVLYRQYDTIGTSFVGSATSLDPASTVTSNGNIKTVVYENVLGRDLNENETLIVSVINTSTVYNYNSWGKYFSVTVEVYGDIDGEEVVGGKYTSGDGFRNYQYINEIPYYRLVRGLKIRRSDIQSWQDQGVYKIRVVVSYLSSTDEYSKFTVLSNSGDSAFMFLNAGTDQFNSDDCIYVPAAGYQASSHSGRMFTYTKASSGSYPVMYSDGTAWYHVYDTGELGDSSSTSTDSVSSEPIAYRSREIALTSGQSAIFTNVFGKADSTCGAALIRKVTNGLDTYTQTEIIDVQQDGTYLSYGPMQHTVSAVPNGCVVDGSFANTNYEGAIGHGSDTANIGEITSCADNTSTSEVLYSFDFSSIPDDAVIDSMSVTVKGRYEDGYEYTEDDDYTIMCQLYVMDANNVRRSEYASFDSAVDQVVTLGMSDAWTREDLLGARLVFRVGYYGGAISGITWCVNYIGEPSGERTETRSIASAVANYDDDFFSSYGNTYTRSAYIEYSYDTSSNITVTDVRLGTPVGLLRGNGGDDYDNLPTAAYGMNSVYKAYLYPNYVYFDSSNQYVYVSDGVLWRLLAVVAEAYYTTEKFQIGSDEMITCYIGYTGSAQDRTIYKLIGVGDEDMTIAGSQTFVSSIPYLYATITSDVFPDGTSGQRYVQFRYPISNILVDSIKISRISTTSSDADIIVGYNSELTTTTAQSRISSSHIVGTTVTYAAKDNVHKLFINTFNRYLYVSDGAMWYYYSTVADSGSRISLALSIDDADYISCGAEFNSSTTKSGYFYLEDSNGGSLTTIENTTDSTTDVRYTVDFTSGDGQAYLARSINYDKYLRYVHDGTDIVSALLTILARDSGNDGLIHVDNITWTSGHFPSIGGYAASRYLGYLALSSSTNLYFSDGENWFYVMTGIREDEYMTSRLETLPGDIVTFSVDFGENTTFTIKKIEYGAYNGKYYFLASDYNYESTNSGVCVSNDDTFTAGSITVDRQGVYFIFPWASNCTYAVTSLRSGTPTGILTGLGGDDYDGSQSASGGNSSIYLASSYPYYLYIDRSNNYMYVSDGAFWHYIKTTQGGRHATLSVPIDHGEMVVFYVTYANNKSFTITKEVTASCDAYDNRSIIDSYDCDGNGTMLVLAVSCTDTELSRYGTEFKKSVRFIYPYETGMHISLQKMYIGDPSGVITVDVDPEYGFNQNSNTGDQTMTIVPSQEDSKYPASKYLSYVCCNNKNGNVFVSDGTYWWLMKNVFAGKPGYYIRSTTLSSSVVSGNDRVALVEQIGDDDIIILNLRYPTAQDFSVRVTRGFANIASSAVTATYSYIDATQAVLCVRATDAAFIEQESNGERYAQFAFPSNDAEWTISKVTANSDNPSNIVYGYHGGNFDGELYVENDYASVGSRKCYASDYAYSLYMDEANGYLYASDGINWHYLSISDVPYYQGVIMDFSDEIGYSYPDVVVTIEQAGRYVLQNETYGTSTEINNCSAGEVITMHGETQTIETNLATHDIAKDFNFEFLRIGNTHDSRTNVIKYCLPATTVIKHTPYVKDLT